MAFIRSIFGRVLLFGVLALLTPVRSESQSTHVAAKGWQQLPGGNRNRVITSLGLR